MGLFLRLYFLLFQLSPGANGVMQSSISSGGPIAEAEAEEATRFQNSLLELRGLRSQLHQAADYCESTFLNTKEKNEVVENTKEYICRAMVTVVDHLGSVTSNLESSVFQANAFSELDLRLNCLKQRLFSCEQYAQKLELSRVRWSEIRPRHHPRYLSNVDKNAEKSNGSLSRGSNDLPFANTIGKPEILSEKPLPVLLYKFYTHNISPSKNLSSRLAANEDSNEKTLAILPVHDGFSQQSKVPNSTFHFQGSQKHGRQRKSRRGTDIFSFIRRSRLIN